LTNERKRITKEMSNFYPKEKQNFDIEYKISFEEEEKRFKCRNAINVVLN